MPSITARDLVKDALMEMGAYSQGETPSAEDADFGFKKLNRLLDTWNARRLFIYDTVFTHYTLTPNLNPHTIGPTGATFTVAQRPVRIESASIVQNDVTPNVFIPIFLREASWWASLTVQNITSTIPTDLYYSPAWPNGEIFLWPIPQTAYGLYLQTWTLLSQLASLNTVINLPPGYQDALTYGLAVSLCPAFAKPVDPVLLAALQQAWKAVQMNNDKTPNISSDFPSVYSDRPYYNIFTGGYSK